MLRLLCNKEVEVVELPAVVHQPVNEDIWCEGGPRALLNGKLNVDWELNQQIKLDITQDT